MNNNNGFEGCDESKCVSRGYSEIHGGSFTCYGSDDTVSNNDDDVDGTFSPRMCADGFLPVVIQSEGNATTSAAAAPHMFQYFTCCPPEMASGESTSISSSTISTSTISTSTTTVVLSPSPEQGNPVRHCSDPIVADGDDTISREAVCGALSDLRIYPREMKSNTKNERRARRERKGITSFVCCDEELSPISFDFDNYEYDDDGFGTNNTTDIAAVAMDSIMEQNFLDSIDCVPYRNDFYDPSRARNQVGQVAVIACDFSDGSFPVPRLVDTVSSGRYRCCTSGADPKPYVIDAAFRITMVPLLALDCVAALASMIVVLGLSIPLVIQLRNGTFHRAQRKRTRNSQSRHTRTMQSSFFKSTSLHQPSTSFKHPSTSLKIVCPATAEAEAEPSATTTEPPQRPTTTTELVRFPEPTGQRCYSTYNLYLVYLAIPDLLGTLVRIALEANVLANTAYNPDFTTMLVHHSTGRWRGYTLDAPVIAAITLANVWLNALISYQVLLLLQSFKRAKRIRQPSLKRVTLQACLVYLGSLLYLAFYMVMRTAVQTAEAEEDFQKAKQLKGLLFLVRYVLCLPPIGYVVCVSAWVWQRGFIPSLHGMTTTNTAIAAASGKAIRELFFYFFRIAAVFVVFWIPYLLLVPVATVGGRSWAFVLAYATWSLQILATTAVILRKSDAKQYLCDLVTLSYLRGTNDHTDGRSENGTPRNFIDLKSTSRSSDGKCSSEQTDSV